MVDVDARGRKREKPKSYDKKKQNLWVILLVSAFFVKKLLIMKLPCAENKLKKKKKKTIQNTSGQTLEVSVEPSFMIWKISSYLQARTHGNAATLKTCSQDFTNHL